MEFIHIRGVSMWYLLIREYILSLAVFTSLGVSSVCSALNVGVFGRDWVLNRYLRVTINEHVREALLQTQHKDSLLERT